jgi:hypothetical protein
MNSDIESILQPAFTTSQSTRANTCGTVGTSGTIGTRVSRMNGLNFWSSPVALYPLADLI